MDRRGADAERREAVCVAGRSFLGGHMTHERDNEMSSGDEICVPFGDRERMAIGYSGQERHRIRGVDRSGRYDRFTLHYAFADHVLGREGRVCPL